MRSRINQFDADLDKLLQGVAPMTKDAIVPTIPENRHRLITQFATLWWKRLEVRKPLTIKEILELQNFFLYLERVMREIPMSPAVPPMTAPVVLAPTPPTVAAAPVVPIPKKKEKPDEPT